MKKYAILFLVLLSFSAIASTVFPTPRPIKPFHLIDNQNNAFTKKNLNDHWTFMFFGFTNCGYVCPTTMQILNHVYQQLKREGKAKNVQVVLVTIDPQRDNVKKLNNYVRSFNKNFIGVTGAPDELKKLSKQLGVLVLKIPHKNDKKQRYDISHSGAVLLFDPNADFYALFNTPLNTMNMVKEFRIITAKFSSNH